MLLRARRTVLMAVVLPAVIMPLMLYAQKYSFERRQRLLSETTYRYAIAGELSDRVRMLIDRTLGDLRERHTENTEEIPRQLRQIRFVETMTADPRASLDNDEIHFYIEALSGGEADKRDAERPSEQSQQGKQRRLEGIPLINVIYRGDRIASDTAHSRMMTVLDLARQQDSQSLLLSKGFPGNPRQLFTPQGSNIATDGAVTGSLVGRFITLFMVMMMFTGGAVAAMDIIAGEKERGTLETLLTTAAGRKEIIAAKQFAITTVAIVITLIQGLNFLLYIKLRVVPLPKGFDLHLPVGMALTLLFLFLPLAAAIASVLLLISAYAKTYKEAQMYFFPVYLAGLLPSLAAILPGISLRSAIAVVPVANVSVAAREILMGRADPVMILLTVGVMVATALYFIRVSAFMLSREGIIVPAQEPAAEFLGGPMLFPKRVIRWFALMWVVIFVAALNVPALATFRRQLLFNEVVVMMGATFLMLKLYGLDVRETLSLRPVKPVVWLAILFAIPSANLTGLAVFRLVNTVLPAPQQLLEKFAQDVIPKDMPLWQLLLYVAVLPAICEELTFRGVLLTGLRRKLRPLALVVSIGVIFGLFHVTLYRLAPTAVLGMMLTAVAVMTGSIFPGMLLHAGNNALGVLGGSWLNPDVVQWWHCIAGVTVFALSLWVIYRNRTPAVGN
jgi:ABC-type Na+ efflux pump permease subunit/membrane protease YdiL (CAAX protease family)